MPHSPMRRTICSALICSAGLAGFAIGCHSAGVDAVVHNHTRKPISLIEVDYPSASFGTQLLAPGQDFKYRFKTLGKGPAKMTYNDSGGIEHTSTGPNLDEGAEGVLDIDVAMGGVKWSLRAPGK